MSIEQQEAHEAEVRQLKKEKEILMDICHQARDQFAQYAVSHAAKAANMISDPPVNVSYLTLDLMEKTLRKAIVNTQFAMRLNNAISQADEIPF